MTRKPCYITRLGNDVWPHKTRGGAKTHADVLAMNSVRPRAMWLDFYGGYVSDWDVYLAHQGPLTIHEEFAHDSR